MQVQHKDQNWANNTGNEDTNHEMWNSDPEYTDTQESPIWQEYTSEPQYTDTQEYTSEPQYTDTQESPIWQEYTSEPEYTDTPESPIWQAYTSEPEYTDTPKPTSELVYTPTPKPPHKGKHKETQIVNGLTEINNSVFNTVEGVAELCTKGVSKCAELTVEAGELCGEAIKECADLCVDGISLVGTGVVGVARGLSKVLGGAASLIGNTIDHLFKHTKLGIHGRALKDGKVNHPKWGRDK